MVFPLMSSFSLQITFTLGPRTRIDKCPMIGKSYDIDTMVTSNALVIQIAMGVFSTIVSPVIRRYMPISH